MEYTEPTYPFTKTEHFDENVMKAILTDEAFSRQDRARLSLYNKHKIGAGRVMVSYRLGLGCEELKLGRLYPEDGLGIQAFSRIIRNPLMAAKYWDLDIENCHYRIAERWAEKNGLKHDKISEYCDERDEILELTSGSRRKAKTEFLKVLYGGNIKLYDETWCEQEGDITKEGNEFLTELAKEVKVLREAIWHANPSLHKFKGGGKGAVAISKKPNPKASLMSLVFQTREREMLMYIDWYLKQAGRPFHVCIHDGGYIEKLPNETQIMFLDWLEKHYDGLCDVDECITLSVKPITHDWKPTERQMSPYERIKETFEKKHAIVGGCLLILQDDDKLETIKLNRHDPRFLHLNWLSYEGVDTKPKQMFFYEEWLKDSSVRRFEKIDFIPDRERCPTSVFNLFNGFEGENHKCKDLTDDEIKELVAPIEKHLDLLTSGNAVWLLDWLANIIQDPMRRSGICPLIRDEGDLLTLGGGTGKTTFFNWIAEHIIGSRYCYSVEDNDELYADFNGRFEGKLFIQVQEANGDANFKKNDVLKAMITKETTFVNKKGIEGYEVKDYSRLLAFTNNKNPFKIDAASRRFAVFDVNPEQRGIDKYFTDLFAHLDKTEVKAAFFKFLKNRKDAPKSPIDWFKSIPHTGALLEVVGINTTPFMRWIIYNLKAGDMTDGLVSEQYEKFEMFVKKMKEGKEATMMSMSAFGRLLANNKKVGEIELGDKHRVASGQYYTWNIQNIVDGLKKQNLLGDEFVYEKVA
jgi:hypothetical protein